MQLKSGQTRIKNENEKPFIPQHDNRLHFEGVLDMSDVRISGDLKVQQSLRWNLFQLLQASARVEGAGIGARGLTGQTYEGRCLWDTEFLATHGAVILVETARLWMSLGLFSESNGGHFCINGVTGPDEYNAVVNNNLYTNLTARENLLYAADTMTNMLEASPERYAVLMDLADIGGNVRGGVPVASIGGTWMAITYGLAGKRNPRFSRLAGDSASARHA